MAWGERPLDTLTLVVTERCNQACEYCYVPKTARDMSRDVAERALDFLFQQAGDSPTVTVAFFGGEPLLVPDLVDFVCASALERARPGQRVIFSLTTNGTALGRAARRLLERYRFQLAVSFDGRHGQRARPLASGASSTGRLVSNLPFLFEVGGRDVLARMTVTPDSAGHFFEDVVSVFEAGFRRIAYLPAYELDWDDLSVRVWQRQLERLVTWVSGRLGARRSVPEFPFWDGRRRILAGQRPEHCGAGVTQVAVSVEGDIYPCYRVVHAPNRRALRLGHVAAGILQPGVRELLASLDPARPQPQAGSCARCPARGACSFFCPALGHILAGDVRLVPAAACRLERVESRVLAEWYGRAGEEARGRTWRQRLGLAAAVAAAVFSPAVASCDRNVGGGGGGQDGAVAEASVPDGEVDRGIMPGVCPVPAPDASVDAGVQPGLCPTPLPDASVDSGVMPGVCPTPLPDASVDSGVMPGVCPNPRPDASVDSGVMPGVCPNPRPDASVDARIQPGLCPNPSPETSEDAGVQPGIC